MLALLKGGAEDLAAGAGCDVSVSSGADEELFFGVAIAVFEEDTGLAADEFSLVLELLVASGGAASDFRRNSFGKASSKISTIAATVTGRT